MVARAETGDAKPSAVPVISLSISRCLSLRRRATVLHNMIGFADTWGFTVIASELVEFHREMSVGDLLTAIEPYDAVVVPSIEHLRDHETAIARDRTLLVVWQRRQYPPNWQFS